MNWQSVNFDWNHARAFLVTAEEGSLSAAARSLGMSQPTLSRQVSALEAELNVVLFERQKMGLELTPTGYELLAHVKAMGTAASSFSLSVAGKSETLEGLVSISATETMATYGLPEVIDEFRGLYPGIKLELIPTHAASDLKRREADIAIRGFRPEQDDLIVRKLRTEKGRLYATPKYLKRIGNPAKPEDLSEAHFIGFDQSTGYMETLNALGLKLTPDQFSVFSNNHVVHWEMVKQGVGIGVMVEEIALKERKVKCVLPDLPPYVSDLWLVTHGELRTNRRVRVVFDYLVEKLGRAD